MRALAPAERASANVAPKVSPAPARARVADRPAVRPIARCRAIEHHRAVGIQRDHRHPRARDVEQALAPFVDGTRAIVRARDCPVPGHPCIGQVTEDQVLRAIEQLIGRRCRLGRNTELPRIDEPDF